MAPAKSQAVCARIWIRTSGSVSISIAAIAAALAAISASKFSAVRLGRRAAAAAAAVAAAAAAARAFWPPLPPLRMLRCVFPRFAAVTSASRSATASRPVHARSDRLRCRVSAGPSSGSWSSPSQRM